VLHGSAPDGLYITILNAEMCMFPGGKRRFA
jgi:hypothetical protein